jgi:hypothetical protein
VTASATNLTVAVDRGALRHSAWNGAAVNWTAAAADTTTVLKTLKVAVGCAGVTEATTRFHGVVDELSLWAATAAAAALPAAVTDGSYRALAAAETAPLIARWRFDDRASVGKPSFPSPAPAAMALSGAAPMAISSSFTVVTDVASVTEVGLCTSSRIQFDP